MHNSLTMTSRYAKAVQKTTLEKVPPLILGFLGFIASYNNIRPADITLNLYADPKHLARFIGFLKARDVSIGQINKHIALARKVNDFLQSGSPLDSPARVHAQRVDNWLAKLESQLSASMPKTPKAGAPDIETTWEWVSELCETALDAIEADMSSDGCLSYDTAWMVQQALMSSINTGCFCPPPRIFVLLSLQHPKCNGCQDKDCQFRDCFGNRVTVEVVSPSDDLDLNDTWQYFNYHKAAVKCIVMHHKNDR